MFKYVSQRSVITHKLLLQLLLNFQCINTITVVRCSIVLCIFANFITKLRAYIFRAVFHIASSSYRIVSSYSIVGFLLGCGAHRSLEVTNKRKETALYIAAFRGHFRIVELLVGGSFTICVSKSFFL